MTPSETPDEAASRAGRRPPDGRLYSGTLPRPHPPVVPIIGRLVRLEPPDPELHDPDPLWKTTHGDDVSEATWRYLSYGPFGDRDAFAAWFAGRHASSDPLWWVAIDETTGDPCGMATLMRIEPDHGVVEIGNLWFVPPVRRSAVTTEAIFLAMRHAFEHGYRRLEWKCDARNAASRRSALRLGFRFEGIFLNHMVIKGRNRDTAWFSITDNEWPAVRAAIERWLEPANFDDDGSRRSSLRDATAALW